jgi:hypothetical protein
MGEAIWTNPYPLGTQAAREESLREVMLAIKGDLVFDDEKTAALRAMFRSVLLGSKTLADFTALVNGDEPIPPPPPVVETVRAENGDLFL